MPSVSPVPPMPRRAKVALLAQSKSMWMKESFLDEAPDENCPECGSQDRCQSLVTADDEPIVTCSGCGALLHMP